ncbi:class IV adenylate cyclase [Candidatus Pacearchaeota archaeon CG10_big_fil_rev_8_21_14_0_10_35_219]|nr:class IV adenylate cyclase [Candidatus Pacearchaeota archaeon]OIO43042.1 MAG: hypothetical protein AUJ63_01305 [Candidatus Pacearchaeota archaeon CG1_02_35_32]PIO08168.1 MAG: class IV adenylate cyclase [Candidatus Pacearchaeota archaeon CG10_big_fil_rev_8_21_14_0_10_35_219]PIY81100.1 MAG: class IV adenylate cyclase [Candidatus Pacearchaeota archaeon CG_4_10_14_0_8_um_filter_35_169]PIZ79749.1 MAG: class IV adenylate cyclase [Candidatus Pacearchaeota archaeon CG_4_10_14_0_2_um_filter_35_33]PJ
MSWIEVEAKIKVHNVNKVRARIRKIAKYSGKEKKTDSYYALDAKEKYPKKSLRIRDKGKEVEVNFKQWLSYKHGVHAKKEIEFHVSDLSGFFDLLDDFGFEKWMYKEKKTELYKTKDGVNIELNQIKGLGWFIEIEILCKENEVKRARRKILEIFERLDLKKMDVEKKGYTKMLWGRRRTSR